MIGRLRTLVCKQPIIALHFESENELKFYNLEARSLVKSMYMSHDMRFPTMWYVRPANAQTSLLIRAVWSEPLLVAWIFYEYKGTDQTSFRVSKLNLRLHRLVWVYSCQNTTLLEIACCGSYILSSIISWACNIYLSILWVLNFKIEDLTWVLTYYRIY